MRGTFHLRGTLLALALTGVAANAQTPTTPPPGTAPATTPAMTPAKATAPAVSPTAEAAKVNGEPLYEQAVQRALERVVPARRVEERPRLLAYLIDNLLIDQGLRAAGYKVEEAEIDKRVADMKAKLKELGKDFSKMLAELKVNETELRHHIAADLRWYKYANAQATDKELTELFTKNKDLFDGSAVKACHILVSPAGKDEKSAETTMAQLQQVKKTIESEVDALMAQVPATTDKLDREKARRAAMIEIFGKYAKSKSECPATKNSGGNVGWFQKSGDFVQPFMDAAFALQPFQISDPVKTPFGYHLIMLTERKAGREVKLEDVKEVVKEVYFDRLHESIAIRLRQKATIVIAK